MMRGFGQGVEIALAALRANKLRTFLTLLGNIVGVTSVVAVVSLLDGMNQYMQREIASEGSGVFRVEQLDQLAAFRSLDDFLASLHNPVITLADAAYLREHVPSAVTVGALTSSRSRFERKNHHQDGEVSGRSAEYPDLEKLTLVSGRHFGELEVSHSRSVAVIGWDVAQALFPGEEPVGKSMEIAGRSFQVVGVVEDLGSSFGKSRNVFAVIPITTYLKYFDPHQSVTVQIKVASAAAVPGAMDEARFAMRIRHRLRPADKENFAVTSSQTLLELWNKVDRAVSSAIIGIVSISLVVGGIVIMNMMLVSVNERTREVGLRKALGARRSDVLWQFLVEAVTISLFGGLIGIALGFAAASLISALTPLPYTIKLWAIAAGILVTGGIGLFFGLYPASRAARLDPIEALRYE